MRVHPIKIGLVMVAAMLLMGSTIAMANDYVVGEGDVLKITVYEQEGLSTVVRVSADNTIRVPLLGQVGIKAMTVSQVARKLTELYADGYLVSPQVNVFVDQYRSKKVIILGQVSKPGLYELQGRTTLLELISKAGGLTGDAGTTVTVKRKATDAAQKALQIDIRKLIEKGDAALNVEIRDGDNIYVSKADIFYVTGEVKKPGSYKYEEGMTIIKAVTTAGGFSQIAAKGRVKIIRKTTTGEKVIENCNMDVPVLPGDVIVVPESYF
jgi:polysaccharide export outer membrane protein